MGCSGESAVERRAGCLVLVTLWLGIVGQAETVTPDPAESTLAAIESYMARAPVPWPQAWQREYLDTIRQAIASEPNAPEGARRLGILRRGFPPYWEGLTKIAERPLFEVQTAQIRWYVEHLMGAQLPSDEEEQRLREQYTDLWDHAALSLLTQFDFLDANSVRTAKAKGIAECYRDIDAPLLPIFLRPFTAEQLDHLKQRWHALRYARIDLWRQIAPEAAQAAIRGSAPPLEVELSLLLAQRSLDQLLGQIWAVGPSPPDYYQAAARNWVEAQRRAIQAPAEARRAERTLNRRYASQLLQTEQLSFLLAALLQTAGEFPSQAPAALEDPNQGGDPNVE